MASLLNVPNKIGFKMLFMVALFCISYCLSFGQKSRIDSLLNFLKIAKEDINKINTLNILAMELRNNNPDTSIYFANQALNLAEKIKFKNGKAEAYLWLGTSISTLGKNEEALKYLNLGLSQGNDRKIISKIYNNIGNIYSGLGNYPESLKNHFAALKIREEIGDKKGIATSHNNIGNNYRAKGNFAEAMKEHFDALKIREEIGDKSGIAMSFTNLSNIYREQGNDSEALKKQMQAIKINEEIGDKKVIAANYQNLGTIYNQLGDYPKALKSYFTSLTLQEGIGNKSLIAGNYMNIGTVYSLQGHYQEALGNYLISLKLAQTIGDKSKIANCFNNLGETMLKLKKMADAKKYFMDGLSVSKDIGSKENMKQSYSGLTLLDSIQGNFKSAFMHFRLYVIYRDCLINEESSKKSIRAEMNFDFDKKEALANAEQKKKDALSAEELKQQKQQRNYFVFGFGIVLLLALFIFRSYRQKQKANRELDSRNQKIESAYHIIEANRNEIAEKNKDITNSINYAKRIQTAILPSKNALNKSLKNGFVLYKPKDIVAGDFYWMEDTGETIIYAAADCTGHGVPGAMVSVVCNNALNRAVREFSLREPAKILDKTRELVIETFDKSDEEVKDGMDIALCSINFEKKELQFAGAFNCIYIIRNKEVIETVADKQPIGKFISSKPFTNQIVQLQKGDSIYSFTDGFADQFGGPKGKKFMYKPFKNLLLSIQEKSMEEQKIIIEKEFNDWKGNMEQVDDVCIISLKMS